MSLVINSNIPSVTAQRHLAESRSSMETSMERLASGKRINSAMDDAAGLAITHKLDAKIAGLNQGVRNANDGISMMQTAEGALEQVSGILTRMKELATQSANGVYDTNSRSALDSEFDQLQKEITRIAGKTDFNGVSVLNSTSSVSFAVDDTSGSEISATFQKMDATTLKVGAGTATNTAGTTVTSTVNAGIHSVVAAKDAMTKVDAAIKTVDSYRGTLGAVENRLDHTVSNLMNRIENQAAARSRIEDADYAQESANLAKNQVLQQAGVAMLAQANQSSQNVLALIQ